MFVLHQTRLEQIYPAMYGMCCKLNHLFELHCTADQNVDQIRRVDIPTREFGL
jgi:hypothetical protein